MSGPNCTGKVQTVCILLFLPRVSRGPCKMEVSQNVQMWLWITSTVPSDCCRVCALAESRRLQNRRLFMARALIACLTKRSLQRRAHKKFKIRDNMAGTWTGNSKLHNRCFYFSASLLPKAPGNINVSPNEDFWPTFWGISLIFPSWNSSFHPRKKL